MVEVIYKDGTKEIVPQVLLKGIIKTGNVKDYKPVSGTKSDLGVKGNYLKVGCAIR